MDKRLTWALLALLSSPPGLTAEQAWNIQSSDPSGQWNGVLRCSAPPHAGPFLDCSITVQNRDKQPLLTENLNIKGGMPAHGHGLPTKPQAEAKADEPGTYRILGLKFSMPGEWVLDAIFNRTGKPIVIRFEFQIQP